MSGISEYKLYHASFSCEVLYIVKDDNIIYRNYSDGYGWEKCNGYIDAGGKYCIYVRDLTEEEVFLELL